MRALRQAKSVAHSSSASGIYLKGLFQRLGLYDTLGDRIRQVEGEPVGAVVARGEAEIGFQQVSELLPVPGIDYVGPLPPEIQHFTVFAAGIAAHAREPDASESPHRLPHGAGRRADHPPQRDGARLKTEAAARSLRQAQDEGGVHTAQAL